VDAVKHGVSRRRRRTTASCITRRWLRTMICSRSSQSRQRRQRLTVGRLSKRPPPRAPRRVTGPARTQQQRMPDPRLPLLGGSGLGAPLSGTLSALPLVLPCLSRSGGLATPVVVAGAAAAAAYSPPALRRLVVAHPLSESIPLLLSVSAVFLNISNFFQRPTSVPFAGAFRAFGEMFSSLPKNGCSPTKDQFHQRKHALITY